MTPELFTAISLARGQDAPGRPLPALQAEAGAPRCRSPQEAASRRWPSPAWRTRCSTPRGSRPIPARAFTTGAGRQPGGPTARPRSRRAQILMERFSEDAGRLQWLREYVQGSTASSNRKCARQEARGGKVRRLLRLFGTIRTIPSHRARGALPRTARGPARRALRLDQRGGAAGLERAVQPLRGAHRQPFWRQDLSRPADRWLMTRCRFTWRVKSFMHLELE